MCVECHNVREDAAEREGLSRSHCASTNGSSRAERFRTSLKIRCSSTSVFSSLCNIACKSVGIATGMLISAVHMAGLASLTHTPSPMGFLNEILGRRPQEMPFIVLVVGYPDGDAQVPDIGKKSLE